MFGFQEQGLDLTQKGLEKLLTDNPEMRKKLEEVIRKLLWEARERLALNIKNMYGGERESWRAVRNIVFKKVIGGNLNLMNMKRNKAQWKAIPKTRKVEQNPHMRGGNRRWCSLSTIRSEGYEGKARGFILRFQNEGTTDRYNKPLPSKRLREVKSKSRPSGKRAYRGKIAGAKFFEQYATQSLNVMAAALNGMIDEEMTKMYNESTKK